MERFGGFMRFYFSIGVVLTLFLSLAVFQNMSATNSDLLSIRSKYPCISNLHPYWFDQYSFKQKNTVVGNDGKPLVLVVQPLEVDLPILEANCVETATPEGQEKMAQKISRQLFPGYKFEPGSSSKMKQLMNQVQDQVNLKKLEQSGKINRSRESGVNHLANDDAGVAYLNFTWQRDCNNEKFSEAGMDETRYGGAPDTLQVKPVLFSVVPNAILPQKYHQTCVKNQGGRGSCAAFAIVAAVESMMFESQNLPKNLSEQYLYAYAKSVPAAGNMAPQPNQYFYDGLLTRPLLDNLVQSQAAILPGDFWVYNTSNSRISSHSGNIQYYQNSCVGYPAPGFPKSYSVNECSDTNHQLNLQQCPFSQSMPVGASQCSFSSTVMGIPMSAPYTSQDIPKFSSSTFNPVSTTGPDYNSLDLLKGYLNAGKTIQLDIHIDIAFMNPTPALYAGTQSSLRYIGSPNGRVVGSHAVEVLGYVDNDFLPQGVPADENGGYLVIRSSWSTGWGDAGYALLSYSYYLQYAKDFNAIYTSIMTSAQQDHSQQYYDATCTIYRASITEAVSNVGSLGASGPNMTETITLGLPIRSQRVQASGTVLDAANAMQQVQQSLGTNICALELSRSYAVTCSAKWGVDQIILPDLTQTCSATAITGVNHVLSGH